MHYINLPSQQFSVHKRRSSRYLRRITPMLIIIGFLVGLGIVFALFKTPASFNYSFKLPFVGYPFSTTDDKVNVLLLGNAGGRHWRDRGLGRDVAQYLAILEDDDPA